MLMKSRLSIMSLMGPLVEARAPENLVANSSTADKCCCEVRCDLSGRRTSTG